VADGHLGIWSALSERHPEGREQRCWNHKLINVLDALPKSEQPIAKELLRDMHFAENRVQCEKKRDQFKARYNKNQPKAVDTLTRDWDRMVTFSDFPKEHWPHSVFDVDDSARTVFHLICPGLANSSVWPRLQDPGRYSESSSDVPRLPAPLLQHFQLPVDRPLRYYCSSSSSMKGGCGHSRAFGPCFRRYCR
jgi:hypothetical protein